MKVGIFLAPSISAVSLAAIPLLWNSSKAGKEDAGYVVKGENCPELVSPMGPKVARTRFDEMALNHLEFQEETAFRSKTGDID